MPKIPVIPKLQNVRMRAGGQYRQRFPETLVEYVATEIQAAGSLTHCQSVDDKSVDDGLQVGGHGAGLWG